MHTRTTIHRGMQFGKVLNTAQRTSSLFAEEPVVLGKVFRRGYPPIEITDEQYKRNMTHLVRLAKAGAITLVRQLVPDSPEDEAILRGETPIVTNTQPPAPPVSTTPVVTEETENTEKTEDTDKPQETVQTAPEVPVTPVASSAPVEEAPEVSKNKKGKNK